ncbi:MAG: hypothetical protein ACXWJD_03980 [Burkholderiaceae bacterium]
MKKGQIVTIESVELGFNAHAALSAEKMLADQQQILTQKIQARIAEIGAEQKQLIEILKRQGI